MHIVSSQDGDNNFWRVIGRPRLAKRNLVGRDRHPPRTQPSCMYHVHIVFRKCGKHGAVNLSTVVILPGVPSYSRLLG